jgi:serpin B
MSTEPSRRALLQTLAFAGLAVTTGTALSACATGPEGSARDGGGAAAGDVARLEVDRAAMGDDRAVAGPALGAVAGDLLRQVLDRERGNVVFSPWSIAVALGMNRAGARSKTASQLDAALHAPRAASDGQNRGLDAALNTAALVLDSHNRDYESGERKGTVTLRSANSTWARPDIAWEQDYLATLGRSYGAGVHLADFGGDPDGSRERINDWVADHTEQRITDLVPDGAITPLTALALVNAVYLEAPWAEDFKQELTAPGTFTLGDGTTRQIPMMHGSLAGATGFAGPTHQSVTLPYLGGTLAMTAVLPRPGQESEVAAWLSSDTGITELLAHPGEPDVEVTMPRFAFQSSVDLEAVLKALGVTDAFDKDRADYSGMTQQERLFISAALHQATIEVDEQGTVATAATAIVMDTTSARVDPQRISLDRPFFFVIHDVEARIPVFVGRVADPSA